MLAWTLQHVALAAALTLLVGVTTRLCRVGPVSRHVMWVIVLVQLITPPLVVLEAPWSWPAAWTPSQPTRGPVLVVESPNDGAVGTPSASTAYVAPTPEVVPFAPAYERVIAPAWLAGALLLAALQVVRLRRLARTTRSGVDADAELLREVENLSQLVGVRPPVIRVVDGLSTPMVWAFRRPVLLWPSAFDHSLSVPCRRGLIVHELAHLKRRDHWIGWLELLGGCLWWWNPLFWYVRAQIREQAELACDAWVLHALPDGRRAYAEALLAVSAGIGIELAPLPALGARAGTRRMLERRLVMIMCERVALRLSRTAALSAGILALATIPVWAQKPVAVEVKPTDVKTTIVKVAPRPAAVITVTKPVTSRDADGQVTPRRVTTPVKAEVRTVEGAVTVQQRAEPKPAVKVYADQDPVVAVDQRRVRVEPRWLATASSLPEDAKKLVTGYDESERAARAALEQKLSKEREELTKQLQALQEKYTKAGQLDEAVAIRNQIRQLQSNITWYRPIR